MQGVQITFASAPANILSRESQKHVGDVLVIMLGDTVLSTPTVWQLNDARVVELDLPFDDERLQDLVYALGHKPGGCKPYTS